MKRSQEVATAVWGVSDVNEHRVGKLRRLVPAHGPSQQDDFWLEPVRGQVPANEGG